MNNWPESFALLSGIKRKFVYCDFNFKGRAPMWYPVIWSKIIRLTDIWSTVICLPIVCWRNVTTVLTKQREDQMLCWPNVCQPNFCRPCVVRASLVRPSVVWPSVVWPSVVRPSVVRPSVVRPSVVRPSVVRPSVVRPSVVRPNVIRRKDLHFDHGLISRWTINYSLMCGMSMDLQILD
jgi:hypothetical protein